MNEIQPTLLSLDPPAARAFEALSEYFERLHKELPVKEDGPLHVHARAHSSLAPSAERAWNLGRMVLARAAEDTPIPEPDALTREAWAMHRGVDFVVRSLTDALGPIPSRRKPRGEAPRESAAALLREIALEERGIEVVVDTAPNGEPVLLAMPIDPAQAVVLSYIQLLEILEPGLRADLLCSLEHDAAYWWFDTWAAPPRTEREEFLHHIRKLEFSLFDRAMLSLHHETIAVVRARRLPTALTPRQRALLDCVTEGICGVFVVRQRRAAMTVLEDVMTGARYEIHEHDVEQEYDEGCLGVGRLVAVPEIGWIRSPGSIIWSPDDDTLSAVQRILHEANSGAYASIVVELVIAVLHGEKVPRLVRPAQSRIKAQKMLDDFHRYAVDFGLAREFAAASALLPEIMSEMGEPALAPYLEVVETTVDEVLKAWLSALGKQAGVTAQSWCAEHDAADDAEVEALLLEELNEPDHAELALLIDFLAGELPDEEIERVAERLRTDAEFREYAKPTIALWTMPLRMDVDPDLLERVAHMKIDARAEAEHERRLVKVRIELRKIGLYPLTLVKRKTDGEV